MRIALISMLERTDESPGELRGALELSGRSLAQRQVEFVQSLGCERVACLTRGINQDVISLQHLVEQSGLRFSTISGARQMLGLASAQDEVLMLADGLLPAAGEGKALLEFGHGIAALPASIGCPAGFERIDAEHAWAGAALLPGRLIERLSELPTDIDPISAMLRIALQAQVPVRMLPKSVMSKDSWLLITSRRDLERIEQRWVDHLLPEIDFLTPGNALASLFTRALSRRGHVTRRLTGYLRLAAPMMAFLGVGGAWFEYGMLGYLLVAAAWILATAAGQADTILREGASPSRRGRRLAIVLPLLLDLSLVAVSFFVIQERPEMRAFLAILPVLALHALFAAKLPRWTSLLRDRALLAIYLGGSVIGGLVEPAIALHVLLVLTLLALSASPNRD